MTLSPHPAPPSSAARRSCGRVVGHTGFTVAGYHSTYVFGLLFPLVAGAVMFGWRADVAVAVVLGTVFLATLIWRRVGTRGHPLRPAQLLRLGLLLALMLPAKLAAAPTVPPMRAAWPLLPAAGLLLVVVCWLAGPGGGGRLHPVVFVYLILAALYPAALPSRTVLQRDRLVVGDVLARADAPATDAASPYAWRTRPIEPHADAIADPLPADVLLAFTNGRRPPAVDTVDALLRDKLPPLEDAVLGAVPGPVGTTSGVAVIFGGLFLIYRGLIDFRVPLLILLAAWGTLLALPIALPTADGGHHWRWLISTSPTVGWATGVTFANYELLSSPLLYTAFFLAGSPSVRPLGRPARAVYAAFIGVASAALQLYVSVAMGSYIAVLVAGVLASDLDRWLSPRPLV